MSKMPFEESQALGDELLPEYHFDYRKAKSNRFATANENQGRARELKSMELSQHYQELLSSELSMLKQLGDALRCESNPIERGKLELQIEVSEKRLLDYQDKLEKSRPLGSSSPINLIQGIDKSQVAQILSDALDADCLSESEIQEILSLLKSKTSAQSPAAQVVENSKLGAKNSLKLSIPVLLPFLSFESELDLSSDFNLNTAWKWVMVKLRAPRN